MMPAYTNFPNCCCRCLRPNPGGTWMVVQRYGGRYLPGTLVQEVTKYIFEVPMCRACCWTIHCRRAIAFLLSAGIGLFTLVAFMIAAKSNENFKFVGMVSCWVAGIAAYFGLRGAFKARTLKDIACIDYDGSEIRFWNDEYQKLYTGECRVVSKRDRNPDELTWR
jgi:hypothetical protein